MGTRILAGRYELLDRIGDGGMAVVYKARCRLLNRFVAIKILKPDFIKDVKFIENFKKESQAAASLTHPNIVNVYDVGREGNINYIVMELIEGSVLSDVIKEEGPLDYRRAIEIAKQIASALSLAHRNNIIHRDVKPHNILITQDGTAKITDFGIAKAVNSSTIVDSDGMIMGSVHYFSPEQARGGYVDEKSDIYSLGIVLYEMLTGKVPFDGDNPVSVALMHVNQEMTPPSKVVAGIPPRLEQIVMKATDKIQINRYMSVDDMLYALTQLEYVTSIVGDSVMGGVRRNQAAEPQVQQVQPSQPPQQPQQTKTIDAANGNVNREPEDIEEDNNGKKKFRISKTKIFAILLALLIGIPASIFLSQLFSGGSPIATVPEVEVPNLIGLTFEQAEDALGAIGLGIRRSDEVISHEHPPGTVVSQDMAAGSSVREGRIIIVNISRAPREGTVPRIVGMPGADAGMMIESFGFVIGTRTSVEDPAPRGIVISQTPEPGSMAEPGTAINFVVSEGLPQDEEPYEENGENGEIDANGENGENGDNGELVEPVEQVAVPELVGRHIDSAIAVLESAGLRAGTITREESDTYYIEHVMWQQHGAGVLLDSGSTVNLRVSLGLPIDPGPQEPVAISFTINYGDFVDHQVFRVAVMLTDEDGTRHILNQQRIRDDFGDNFNETLTLVGRGEGSVTVIIDDVQVLRRNLNFNTGAIY